MDAALAVRRQAEAYQAAVGDLGEWLNSSASAPAAKEEKKDVQVVEEALLAKEMGNALVAKGRFEKALEAYTKSIALDPSQGMVYSNRALVWLKLSCFAEADKDCSEALSRIPVSKSVKVLWRRGLARKALGNLEDAKKDLERALVLEPANRPLKEELQALTLLLKKEKPETPLKVVPKASPKVTATERPIRRRILIEEIGEAEPLLVSKDEASPSDQPMVPPAAEETLAPALKSLSLVTKESLSPPTSLLDFERDYASLKQDLSLWSAYVRMIPPSSYPTLFKNAFETDHLSSFLQAISSDLLPSKDFEFAFDILKSLKSVERFSTARMFLPKAHKGLASEIFDVLGMELKDKPVAALRSQYYKC